MAETFEFGDLVGDWYLFGRLLRLGSERNPQPLLTLSGDQTSIRSTEAVLTPFGEEVLKGTASNYPANPIDDWAAGVRLSSEQGALWFNDGGKLVRAKKSGRRCEMPLGRCLRFRGLKITPGVRHAPIRSRF